jgi:hypothetical protein
MCSELGYLTKFIKDAIAAYNWDEIKVTLKINFSKYDYILGSTKDFIDILKK